MCSYFFRDFSGRRNKCNGRVERLLTEGGRELSKRCGCGLLLISLCPTRSSVSRKAENADVEFLSFFFGGKNAFQMLTANSGGSHGQLIKY